MNQPKVKRGIGKYEIGRTIGEGTFAKVKLARIPRWLNMWPSSTKSADQIRREIATRKLIKHTTVVQLYEVPKIQSF
ncbi:hypothetical protein ABFX02_12G047100 [Erythranthe guttata]